MSLIDDHTASSCFSFFLFLSFFILCFFFVAVFFFGGFGVAVSASSAVVSFAVVCCLGRPCGPALLLCLLLLFGAAVWASSAVVCFCSCLGRSCGPALLLYFFVLFGAAVWASSAVVFFCVVWGGRVGQLCCCGDFSRPCVWGGTVGQLYCFCLGRCIQDENAVSCLSIME